VATAMVVAPRWPPQWPKQVFKDLFSKLNQNIFQLLNKFSDMNPTKNTFSNVSMAQTSLQRFAFKVK
jgi:tRNA U34 5-methylaminomethyl-2-thiouridine-forming methyltransferase MnmC